MRDVLWPLLLPQPFHTGHNRSCYNTNVSWLNQFWPSIHYIMINANYSMHAFQYNSKHTQSILAYVLYAFELQTKMLTTANTHNQFWLQLHYAMITHKSTYVMHAFELKMPSTASLRTINFGRITLQQIDSMHTHTHIGLDRSGTAFDSLSKRKCIQQQIDTHTDTHRRLASLRQSLRWMEAFER